MNTNNGDFEEESKEERTSEKIPVNSSVDFSLSGELNTGSQSDPEKIKEEMDKGIAQNESPAKPKLRAATAILILFFYLAGQALTAMFFTIFEIIKHVIGGGSINNQTEIQGLISDAMPQIVFVSTFGGALAFAVSAYVIRKSLQDTSPFGAAWTIGKPKVLVPSFLLGVCAAFIFIIISAISFYLFPSSAEQEGGLLAQMAAQSGYGQLVFVILAIFMAPLIEELLFRGILLGGLNRSFGVWWGIAVSNLLFILLHYSEAIHFWPAFIGIGLLSALATRQRFTQNAIGPAVAVHFGYNLIIVGSALIA